MKVKQKELTFRVTFDISLSFEIAKNDGIQKLAAYSKKKRRKNNETVKDLEEGIEHKQLSLTSPRSLLRRHIAFCVCLKAVKLFN